jgi:hypothetical protein
MEEKMLDEDLWNKRIGRLDDATEPEVMTEAQIRWKEEEDTRRILDENQIDAFHDEDEEVEVEDEVRQPEGTPSANHIEDQNPTIDVSRVVPSEPNFDNRIQSVGPVRKEPDVVPPISPVPTPVINPDDAQVTVGEMNRIMRQYTQQNQTPQLPRNIGNVETPRLKQKGVQIG